MPKYTSSDSIEQEYSELNRDRVASFKLWRHSLLLMNGATINAEEKSTIKNSSFLSKVKKFNGTILLQYQSN